MAIVDEDHILTGYNPISLMGMMDTYPSTKDAMQETRVKDAILKSFSDFVRLGIANKCMSTKKNAGPELAGCILEYPKVIVEPHYTQDVKAMAEAFKEVSAVRLPFPKMTIISGEMADIDFNDDSEIRQAKNNEDQNGSVNMLYCYFLSEVSDGIEIKVLLGKPNDRNNIYIDTAKIVHDGEELRCMSVVEHVRNCPLCSKYFSQDKTHLYIIILFLFIVSILLIKKILESP